MTRDEPEVEVVEAEERSAPPFYRRADRERAMLTRTDRELLLGLKEYDSEQGLRNARHRLREHVRHSLHDIFLVANVLDQDELEQLMERQSKLDEEGDCTRISHSAGAIKLGCRLGYISSLDDGTHTFEERVESDVALAVRSIIERLNEDVVVSDVNVDISVETEEVDEMLDELVFGNPEMHSVTSYLERGDPERLRERLRELDEVIDLAGGQVISPDHEIFDLFSGGDPESV